MAKKPQTGAKWRANFWGVAPGMSGLKGTAPVANGTARGPRYLGVIGPKGALKGRALKMHLRSGPRINDRGQSQISTLPRAKKFSSLVNAAFGAENARVKAKRKTGVVMATMTKGKGGKWTYAVTKAGRSADVKKAWATRKKLYGKSGRGKKGSKAKGKRR